MATLYIKSSVTAQSVVHKLVKCLHFQVQYSLHEIIRDDDRTKHHCYNNNHTNASTKSVFALDNNGVMML